MPLVAVSPIATIPSNVGPFRSIPNCVAWWDASLGLGLSGSNVTTAADVAPGGTANTATGKSGAEPQFVASDGGGPCFDFATGRVFTLAHTADLNLTTAFTITGWIKRSVSGVNHILYASSLSGAEKLRIILNNGDALSVLTDGSAKLNVAYTTTAWHHFACTYNGSLGSQRLVTYLDGSVATRGFDVEPAASLSATDTEVFGAYYDTTTQPFNGRVAWFGIFNRALTAAEVLRCKAYQPRA